jgi:hypothetical protein
MRDDAGRVTDKVSAKTGRSMANKTYTAEGLIHSMDIGAAAGQPGHIGTVTYNYITDENSEFRNRMSSIQYSMASGATYQVGGYQYEPGTGLIQSFANSYSPGAQDPIGPSMSTHQSFQYDDMGQLTGYQIGSSPGMADFATGQFGYDILGSRIPTQTFETVFGGPFDLPAAPPDVPTKEKRSAAPKL